MIGIDVGGANLKVVDEEGVHIHYCPLWRESNLAEILAEYKGADAAVVMSGELADGFFNKAEGISYIVGAVQRTFPNARFYGTDGRFHSSACPELAAANWLASVEYPAGMMLDIGSTTADIVPFARFDELRGLTDTLRLQRGYLVYTGMLRTPVATLASSAVINGKVTPFSTEYFACSGDAHYVIGNITEAEYTAATPDGKEVSREACLRRLARTVEPWPLPRRSGMHRERLCAVRWRRPQLMHRPGRFLWAELDRPFSPRWSGERISLRRLVFLLMRFRRLR